LMEVKEQLYIAQSQPAQPPEMPQIQQPQACQPCVEPMPVIFCFRPDTEKPTSWIRGEFLMWTAEAGDLARRAAERGVGDDHRSVAGKPAPPGPDGPGPDREQRRHRPAHP